MAIFGKTRNTFSNSDLPAGTLKKWQAMYLPAWYQHLGTLKDPWSLGDLLPEAQRIWDKVFPHNAQTLAGTGEPIFYLVIGVSYPVLYYTTNLLSICTKTKQRSYEWRGSFATAAITAIQDFWNSDPQYENAGDRANFVEWAIPAEDEEPSPFTWNTVDETDSDNIVNTHFHNAIRHILTNSRYIKVPSSHLPSFRPSAPILLPFPTYHLTC